MAEKRDYYEVLGLSKNASEADIKSSFRKLSRKWHPDMQAGKSDAQKKEAEEHFKEIAEAYEVLSDRDKRANYDQFGFASNTGSPFGGMDMGAFFRKHSSMFEDMFSDGFSPFGFSFNSNHGNHKEVPDPSTPENGRNVQINVKISFKEMTTGCTKDFDINLSDPCPDCNGTGVEKGSKVETCPHCHGQGMITERIQQGFMISMTTRLCPHCNGQGYKMKVCKKCNGQRRISVKKHISIKIPQGVENGQRLRLKDMGECGVCGGQNGNLYANVVVEDSKLFERNGINITVKKPISPILATLGGSIEVPSPYGYCKTTVPKETKNSDRIVVYGKGLKTEVGTGNLVVVFEIDTICNASVEQKKLLEELQKLVSNANLKQSTEYDKLVQEFYK